MYNIIHNLQENLHSFPNPEYEAIQISRKKIAKHIKKNYLTHIFFSNRRFYLISTKHNSLMVTYIFLLFYIV